MVEKKRNLVNRLFHLLSIRCLIKKKNGKHKIQMIPPICVKRVRRAMMKRVRMKDLMVLIIYSNRAFSNNCWKQRFIILENTTKKPRNNKGCEAFQSWGLLSLLKLSRYHEFLRNCAVFCLQNEHIHACLKLAGVEFEIFLYAQRFCAGSKGSNQSSLQVFNMQLIPTVPW